MQSTCSLKILSFALSISSQLLLLALPPRYVVSEPTGGGEETLRNICAETTSGQHFEFTGVKQLSETLKAFERQPSLCPHAYHDAFWGLKALLDAKELKKDVCSLDAFLRIQNYHHLFISRYLPDASKEELELAGQQVDKGVLAIPRSLRRFFVLFVLQLSAQCKRTLFERLDGPEKLANAVSDADFELLDRMSVEAERLFGAKSYKTAPSSLNDLTVLPVNQLDPNEEGSKLYIRLPFGDALRNIHSACERTFRPIYEELFVPVIRFNNLGYYDGVNSERENLMLETEEKVLRWLSVIQSCESLKDIEIIEDSSSLSAVAHLLASSPRLLAKNRGESAKKDLLQVLSREEAEEMRAQIAKRRQKFGTVRVSAEQADRSAELRSHSRPLQEVKHGAVAMAGRLWVKDTKTRDREVAKFEERVRSLVKDKTNFWRLLRRNISNSLTASIHKHRLQLSNKDTNSALGKIAAFMEKHKTALRIIQLLVTALIIVHLAG